MDLERLNTNKQVGSSSLSKRANFAVARIAIATVLFDSSVGERRSYKAEGVGSNPTRATKVSVFKQRLAVRVLCPSGALTLSSHGVYQVFPLKTNTTRKLAQMGRASGH